MGYYRTDQIYERLNNIVVERQCWDGSNSFGQIPVDADEQLSKLNAEEVELLAELSEIETQRDWCRPSKKG